MEHIYAKNARGKTFSINEVRDKLIDSNDELSQLAKNAEPIHF
ncbi:unnamed protein product [Acidithrix sp. C25]|nr:unnamed protein product [Acidithrix sp. C25]